MGSVQIQPLEQPVVAAPKASKKSIDGMKIRKVAIIFFAALAACSAVATVVFLSISALLQARHY